MNLVSLNPCNKISCYVLKQSSVAVRTFSILICEVCSDVALRQTYGEAESASNNLGRFLAIVGLVRALWGIRDSNRGIFLSVKAHTNRQDIKTQCFGTNVPICVPCGTETSYGSWLCLCSYIPTRVYCLVFVIIRKTCWYTQLKLAAPGIRMFFVRLHYKGHRHRGHSTFKLRCQFYSVLIVN